jgi:hypothetical protein
MSVEAMRSISSVYWLEPGGIISSTSLPFSLMIKGVPVLAAISRARCAARAKAAGTACMSASGNLETGSVGWVELMN